MYCSTCGNQISDALKYCNNCGAKQKKGKEKDKSVNAGMLDDILTTLFLVVMFGLGILVGLVAVLLDKEIPRQLLAVITLGYLAAIFGICFMLMSQAKRLISASLEQKDGEDQFRQEPMPLQMPPKRTNQLVEHFEPAVSVTENTTRDLDAVERKIDSKL
jgi:hypothetical protein